MISSLILRNFGPFRGEHRLDLAPTTYAVVARRDDDPEASNMGGKSWFLSAIRFALYGSHLADLEDEWVTRGEREGGVEMTVFGDVTIKRTRRFGDSTQLVVGDARGKDAQQTIDRMVGLSEKDFLTAAFFEQKAMARFIQARSSVRSEDVAAWLRLGRIQGACKRVSDLARGLADEEADVAVREGALRARLSKIDAPTPATLQSLESAARVRAAEVADKEEELAAGRRLVDCAQVVRHREQLLEEVRRLDVAADGEPDVRGLEQQHAEALQVKREAFKDASDKRVLAAGAFRGECPVNGCACPIADQLNDDRGRNRSLAAQADANFRNAANNADRVSGRLDAARKAQDASRTRRARLQALREQLAQLDASAPVLEPGKAIPDGEAVRRLEQELKELRDAEKDAVIALARASRAADDAAHLFAELDQVVTERAQLAAELRIYREAASVLGRNGAQRRIAEGALREVEADACALLSEAGVDLSVRLLWDRPTDQLAVECDACGASFPPGRKVKACGRCGVPRGPKLAGGLDVELSKVSGFAEDAAGIALSLAASAWLRRERDVQWPVLCADEAWAAADPKNRRALLNLFKIAGRRCGIRQMFLVAHSDALMDSLPGRIEVVAGPDGSRVSVVG